MVMQSLTSGPKHDNPVGFSGARSNVDDDIKSEVVVQALVNIEGKSWCVNSRSGSVFT